MSEIYDLWNDDNNQVDPGELTVRLTELRDNIEPPLPAKGEARRKRIDTMQRELNAIQAFVEDCDRYAEQTREITGQHPDVRLIMARHLAKLRARAVDNGRQLNSELQYLRSQTR